MEGIIFITIALAPRYSSKDPKYLLFLRLPVSLNHIAAWRVLMLFAMALIFFPSYYLCRLAIGAEVNLETITHDLFTIAFVCLINGVYYLYHDLKTIFASQIFARTLSIAVPLIVFIALFSFLVGQVHSLFWFVLIALAIILVINMASIFSYIKRKSYIQ